ncbi:MAG: CocE/NonD family hydrolase [Planctomycetes bacterium]|nr:CocE/NonD family hydrolase [Planctomycetota bacterium]
MTETMGQARNARVMQNVAVPMRDGVPLMTTIFLPLAPAESGYPAVLVRTAYNRAGFGPGEFTERGLTLVVQDCRGRYGSEGDFVPFVNETRDGEDTLAWLAAQPWCNGRIGMFGDSYLAATQFAVGASGVPGLCALNPRFMAGDIWRQAYYCDGAFGLGLT